MSLTDKQREGLEIIEQRYSSGAPYVTVAGLAGTGKTYLIRRALEELDIGPTEYKMATFTGKAALVLRQRGFEAVTLHKLLYKSIPIKGRKGKEDGFIHVPKKKGEGMKGIKVIVIDEISMVPNPILKEAAKHEIFIIALGDPFQLPPIGEDNGLLQSPHIFLDEVVRQAKGNSIIELAHRVRNYDGAPIEVKNDDNIMVVYQDEMVDGMLGWADQILCSRNETRKKFNSLTRKTLGYSGSLPEEGEKVIFTKNNWDRVNSSGYALVNGLIGTVSDIRKGRNMGLLGQLFTANVEADFSSAPFEDVVIDGNTFRGIDTIQPRGRGKEREMVEEADFGYCITVHKSQGSEFDNVLLLEERLNRAIDLRVLYVGVTRAAKKLVLVIPRQGSKFVRVD